MPICDHCLRSFALIPEKFCGVCGQPLEALSRLNAEHLLCRACKDKTYAFDLARSYAVYQGALVRAILLLKFERSEPLGTWFAQRLVEVVKREAAAMAVDDVVPVPLHRERERERGYNQADMIAKPLARKLKLPHRPILLMRTRPRPDKHILSLEERWEFVRGAFAMHRGSRVDNLRVLLVDDVMMTGATLDACSRALREAGAKSVIGLTVARAARPAIPVDTER